MEQDIVKIKNFYSTFKNSKGKINCERTVAIYINMFKRVCKASVGVEWIPVNKFTNKMSGVNARVYDFIFNGVITNGGDPIAIRSTILNAVFHVLLALSVGKNNKRLEFWHALSKHAHQQTLTTYRRDPTPNEVEKYISWNDIIEKKKELYKKRTESRKDFENFLLLALYTTEGLPPLRQEEWADTTIFICDINPVIPQTNYFVIQSQELHIFKDKTDTKRIIKIPPELTGYITEFFSIYKNIKVLESIRGSGWTGNHFYFRFLEIFGKNISTSMLRKIYISTHLPSRPIDERREIAKQMGHSLNTQDSVYCSLTNFIKEDY